MNKNYLLLIFLAWCSSFAYAILPTPAIVSPLHGSSGQNVNVMLDWGNVTGATLYEYRLSLDPSLTGASNISTGTNSYVNTSNLLFGTSYYWAVRAKSTTDSSNWSVVCQFTTLDDIAMVGPSNGAIFQQINVMLDWGNVSGASTFDLEIDTSADFNSTLRQYQSIPGSNSYYNTSNLLFATKYYWRVRAINATDTTIWSSVWNFNTHDNITLIAPSNNTINQNVDVQLDWSSANGISFYDVEIDTNINFNSPLHQYQSITGSNSYYYTSNLRFSTKYYWRARARHSADTTSWTPIWNFTTHDNISLLTPTNGAINQPVDVQLDWSSVTGTTSYDMEIDTNVNFNSALHQYVSTANSYFYTSNLRFSTKYYWRARARHSADTTSWSPIWNFTTQETISLVSPSNGAVNQDVNVQLDWSTVSGSNIYDLEIDTSANFTSGLYQYLSTANSYYNTSNLLFSTKYYWRVRARHSADTTIWFPVWSFTTQEIISLVSPSVGAVNQDVNVQLDWSTVSGSNIYDLEIDTSANFTSGLYQYLSTANSYYYTTNLLFSTKYYWRVRARHSADTTIWFPVWSFTTKDGRPPHVSPLNGASGVSLNPTIDWSIVNGIIRYEYQYSVDSNFTSAPIIGTGTTSQAGLTSLSYGEKYFWRVRCSHAVDTSDWSIPWKFTTLYQLTNPVQLSSPANGAIDVVSSTVSLEWQLLATAVFYEYSYSTNASFIGAVTGTTTSLSMTTSLLNQGTTYYWKVRGNNGSGYSPWSSVWTFSTSGIGIPLLLSPSNGATNLAINNILLDWENTTNTTLYEYQYSADPAFVTPAPPVVSGTTTVSNVTINGLVSNITYYWRVRSVNGANLSPWSAVWSFTTAGAEVPVLVSPANGAVNIATSNQVLDWNNTSGTTFYEYQYSADVVFTTPISATSTVSSAIINGLANNTTYYWRVRGNDGNNYSSWSTVWSFTTGSDVGIQENERTFTVFPNPSSESVFLKFSTTNSKEITLYNSLGISVWHGISSEKLTKIDVSFLASGVYFVKVKSDNSVVTQPIIKK